MTDFTLEILDGDRAGQTVPLLKMQWTIGRRATNDLVLDDDKCSGSHAEIVVEDGQPVLRDLGSTNGTFLDGQQIQEIALGHGDEFRVGKTRIRFLRSTPAGSAPGAGGSASVAAGGSSSGAAVDGGSVDEVSVSSVDTSRLGRRKRRSLLMPLLLLVVVAAVVVVVVLDPFSESGGSRIGSKNRNAPIQIAGNLLSSDAATFDGEETPWNLAVSTKAVDFDFGFGPSANSGRTGLTARPPEPGAGGSDGASFAIARTTSPVRVERGARLRIGAFVRTEADARAMVRVRFEGPEGDSYEPRTTGSAPRSFESGFEEVAFEVGVPNGARSAFVELVAFLPRAQSQADFDDVFVVAGGSVPTLELSSGGGATLYGAGADLGVRKLETPLVFATLPVVGSDPFLTQLAQSGLLTASDGGLSFAAEPLPDGGRDGFAILVEGPAFELRLPSAASLRIRLGDEDLFSAPAPDFESDAVAEVLVGAGPERIALVPDAPARVVGRRLESGYALAFTGVSRLELRTSFGDAPELARSLLREAARASDYATKLDLYDQIAQRTPHDEDALREAARASSDILREIELRVTQITERAGEASLFDAPVGYRRVLDNLAQLERDLGPERFAERESLVSLRSGIEKSLARREGFDDAAHAARLQVLAESLGDLANGEALSTFVADYAETLRRETASEAPGPGEGDNR